MIRELKAMKNPTYVPQRDLLFQRNPWFNAACPLSAPSIKFKKGSGKNPVFSIQTLLQQSVKSVQT